MMRGLNRISRIKQIIIFLIVIISAVIFKLSGLNNEYRSAEEVLYACEKGLHYGPSKEILYVKRTGDKALVIGRTDEGLSSVPTQKKWYGTWELLKGGVIDGNLPVENNSAFYDDEFNFLYGWCNDKKIVNLKITLGSLDGIKGKNEYGTYDINVDSNGFFYMDVPPIGFGDKNDYVYPIFFEGFDEGGQLVYSYDELEK